jgi:uroporphyrin-III C-methyltransferase/precorrin-2 dehydrogenase/sirohydrochlorin ferrochelatase
MNDANFTTVGAVGAARPRGHVALVGAGPGDPDLWTVRGLRLVREADLVLYDALIDSQSLRALTGAQLFCVGKRAGRASVSQETIDRLMIRAARRGRRVVRLKGGDPFVFGRGGEEMMALAHAGVSFEVVPGVTTAVSAPEVAGIPLTHRGVASAFVVVAGHTPETLDGALRAVRPEGVTVVVLMALAGRAAVAERLVWHGWSGEAPAAIVCAASTPDAWTWTGRLKDMGAAEPPVGLAGVLVVGDVVNIRAAVASATAVRQDPEVGEVKYGRH